MSASRVFGLASLVVFLSVTQAVTRFVGAADAVLETVPASGIETREADLLVVGGNESACAAALQAARLGVNRVVLVNDIEWLGGQFSAEGVGCLDEWTTVEGRRVNFPRSGMFLEMVQRIRAHNSGKYGVPAPGNAFCGTETIEPAAAAKLFSDWLRPETSAGSGRLRILSSWRPSRAELDGQRLVGVEFESTQGPSRKLIVRAPLTIDASDWGDVIRMSGARYGAGPDLRSRFGEPSAPEVVDADGRNEMNPLSWCLVLREAGRDATIQPPSQYDPRSFSDLDRTPPWVDSDMTEGIYAPSGWSIYTHRRLVDRWHLGLPIGSEKTFLNWPVQDYPLCMLPARVVNALEANEPGASRKNIVDMTPAQREIVFADAKQHALGLLYHLQTKVHERVGDFPHSFRYLDLTDEFGTPDRLPPKPYVREGLRLEALYMLREQDIRAATREPRWAKSLPPDSVLGFQFNIDFHPTRRKFEQADRDGPWRFVHTGNRNWHTDTDRAVFPLRGLVPVERDGLLGGGKNVGVSSVVQSSFRLHGQMMLVGQAAGTVAWLCLTEAISPREVAASPQRWRAIQQVLVRGRGGPGVLLFPWHDLPPDHLAFEGANQLAVRGIWTPDSQSLYFRPEQVVTRGELARLLVRLRLLVATSGEEPSWIKLGEPRYRDVPADHPDREAIETMIGWGKFGPQQETFMPDGAVQWGSFARWLEALGLPVHRGLLAKEAVSRALTRGDCARFLWSMVAAHERATGGDGANRLFQTPDSDADQDGKFDLDDPLPFDRDNDHVPDRLDSPEFTAPRPIG